MVSVNEKQSELNFDGPSEVTLQNVRYWSRHTKEMSGSMASKALLFVKHDCIQYIGKAFENFDGVRYLKPYYKDAKHPHRLQTITHIPVSS